MSTAKAEQLAPATASVRVDQVLETATRLFFERGYDAASVRDLAAELAMRPSSLYHHFPGKQHILFAICFGMQSDFNATLLPLFAMDRGPLETLKAALREQIRFSLARRGEVLVSVRERRSLPPDLRRRVNLLRREYRDAVIGVIEEGRRKRLVKVADAKLAAMAMLDMVNGLFQWFQPRDDADRERITRIYVEFAIAMLGGTPG